MTAAPPKYRLRVRSSWLHVRYSRPPEQSAGGVWLPGVAGESSAQAVVLAAGPRAFHGEPGAVVIAAKHSFTPITKEEAQVRDQDLLALVYEGEDGQPVLAPANDYLLIARVEAEEQTRGGLWLPQISRKRGQRGRILDWGMGKLREEGPLAGTRRTPFEIMNIPLVDDLVGRECLWTDRTAAVQVTSAGSACWLLPASKVDLMEW